MAGSAKNWLIGCGIGCGLLVVLGLGLGAAGFFGVRSLVRKAETLEAVSDSLATVHGSAAAWAPPADGSLDPSRVEAFLEARRLMAPAREKAARTFATLDGSGGGNAAAKMAAGVNFVPNILALIEARDRALLGAGMGPGEYQFLYSTAFFGLLGKDPGDGPGFSISGDGDSGRGSGRGWSFGTSHESGRSGDQERGDVERRRANDVRELLNRLHRENLRRQLAALDAAGAGDAARRAWRAELAAEVAALDAEPRRFAWEQGLPAPLRATLEPFRARLEESYDPLTGALELGLTGHDGDQDQGSGEKGDGAGAGSI